MTHTGKGFSVVNETEADVFLEFPCFLYDPVNAGNLISSSSAFSKPSLDICEFSVHIMLKPSLKDFEHKLTSMGDEFYCSVVSTFFSTALLGNWDEYNVLEIIVPEQENQPSTAVLWWQLWMWKTWANRDKIIVKTLIYVNFMYLYTKNIYPSFLNKHILKLSFYFEFGSFITYRAF